MTLSSVGLAFLWGNWPLLSTATVLLGPVGLSAKLKSSDSLHPLMSIGTQSHTGRQHPRWAQGKQQLSPSWAHKHTHFRTGCRLRYPQSAVGWPCQIFFPRSITSVVSLSLHTSHHRDVTEAMLIPGFRFPTNRSFSSWNHQGQFNRNKIFYYNILQHKLCHSDTNHKYICSTQEHKPQNNKPHSLYWLERWYSGISAWDRTPFQI